MKVVYFNITERCNLKCWFCAAIIDRSAELSTAKVLSILDRIKVGKGDRVIINGGEATLHKGLCRIFKKIRERGAQSQLFSNGIRLSKYDEALRLAKCGMDYVCVPLYGRDAEHHDSMTGTRGSFSRTCRGIDNLCRLKHEGYPVRIEVKLLHCRPTHRSNPSIARWIIGRFPDIDCISVNPPLYTGEAGRNLGRFAIDMRKSKAWLNRTIRAIVEGGMKCSMPHIPYCFLDRKLQGDEHRRTFLPYPMRMPVHYFDPNIPNGVRTEDHPRWIGECLKCRYKIKCPGFIPQNLGNINTDKSALNI